MGSMDKGFPQDGNYPAAMPRSALHPSAQAKEVGIVDGAPHLCANLAHMDRMPLIRFLAPYRKALLPQHGEQDMRAMIRAVLQHELAIPFPELEPERILSTGEAARLEQVFARLLAGEPLQYVLGHVDFHGLQLAVDPRVLIPRPETEELVERIVQFNRPLEPLWIVDIGTGSGCIALALKQAFPSARVSGMDRSAPALALAQANGTRNGLTVAWKESDALGPDLLPWLQAGWAPGRTIVVSNPPYVPRADSAEMQPQVLLHEPHAALFVPDDDPHRFYRSMAAAVARCAVPGDELWFEAHYRFAPGTARVVEALGFPQVELMDDLSGNPRFIRAWK